MPGQALPDIVLEIDAPCPISRQQASTGMALSIQVSRYRLATGPGLALWSWLAKCHSL